MILQKQKQISNNSLDVIGSDKNTNPLFRNLTIQRKEVRLYSAFLVQTAF